ncbi:MAG: DUF4976 domain-containing protein [Rhodobacteraceae bacterium]|nr:DUF4976 domain-containing protein [Paracoccaceae bacterium]MYF45098.1 DUF4976 domain-containing protein [Paracoccaceae bacterium]MYI92069.1 DUF4976 domain-containing protein [Paracoccaceae bacterium]
MDYSVLGNSYQAVIPSVQRNAYNQIFPCSLHPNSFYFYYSSRVNLIYIRNLITDSHRLTIYKGLDTGELYDLNTDSNETRNLWDDPDCMDLKSELMFRLNQTMLEAIEPGPRPLRYA